MAQRHPEHQELQELWLEALADWDPGRALAVTDQVQIDSPALFLVRARLLAGLGKFQEGLDLLTNARGKPSLSAGNVHFQAAAAEIHLLHFLASGNSLFLADAEAQLESVTRSKDPYVGAVTVWLARIRGKRSIMPLANTGTVSDLHVRRIWTLMTEASAVEIGQRGKRFYLSHAQQNGVVWQHNVARAGYVRVPQDLELSGKAVREFQRLGVEDPKESIPIEVDREQKISPT